MLRQLIRMMTSLKQTGSGRFMAQVTIAICNRRSKLRSPDTAAPQEKSLGIGTKSV